MLLKHGIKIHGEAGSLEPKNDIVVFVSTPSWHKFTRNLVKTEHTFGKNGYPAMTDSI